MPTRDFFRWIQSAKSTAVVEIGDGKSAADEGGWAGRRGEERKNGVGDGDGGRLGLERFTKPIWLIYKENLQKETHLFLS